MRIIIVILSILTVISIVYSSMLIAQLKESNEVIYLDIINQLSGLKVNTTQINNIIEDIKTNKYDSLNLLPDKLLYELIELSHVNEDLLQSTTIMRSIGFVYLANKLFNQIIITSKDIIDKMSNNQNIETELLELIQYQERVKEYNTFIHTILYTFFFNEEGQFEKVDPKLLLNKNIEKLPNDIRTYITEFISNQ